MGKYMAVKKMFFPPTLRLNVASSKADFLHGCQFHFKAHVVQFIALHNMALFSEFKEMCKSRL